jgi:AcrR family transcriptional regulator
MSVQLSKDSSTDQKRFKMGLREKKEAQTREMIFKVALSKFCKNSIEGTKLKDIAEEAVVSERTLYRYFPTKEALAEDLYLTNLRILNDDSIFKELITDREMTSFCQNMNLFKQEIIDGIRDIPDRLLYDLLYNVFAARRHVDPAQNKKHFMQRDWYKEASESWGEDGVLIYEAVSMLLAYTQRLIMLEYQRPVPDWDLVIHRFDTIFECSVKGVTEKMSFFIEDDEQ